MLTNDPNLILIKSITALYLNRLVAEANGKLETVLTKILPEIRMPVENIGDGSDGEIANSLRSTMEWLKGLPSDIVVSEVDLIERVRMNCAFGSEYIDVLQRTISHSDDDYENSTRIRSIVSELQHALRNHEVGVMVRKAHKEINFNDGGLDIEDFLSRMDEGIKDFKKTTEAEHEGFGGRLSTEDPNSVVEVMERTQEMHSTEGSLRTGLKGLNRLLGGVGHSRGEQFNYGALTHNYKSGILLDYCRWFTTLNEPYLFDKNKKPLILRISFENRLEQDLPILYKSLWEAEHQKKCDIRTIDAGEAARYVISKFTAKGWNFEALCFDPNNFDVWDLVDLLASYEAKGYEIGGVIIDYPELITKKASGNRRQDENITYTFEVLRNHCFPRNITQITAHQLSTEAQKLAREGTSNFAKKVATGSYYMNCQSLATKLDGECILHIHPLGDDFYLTFARGKHRGGDQTPVKHRSFAYKFQKFGGIVDDVDEDEDRCLYTFSGVDGGEGGMTEHNGAKIDDDW